MEDPSAPLGLREFDEFLSTLTMSRESIHTATRMAIDRADIYEDIFRCILRRLDKAGTASRRLPYFYLVDSLSQTAKAKNLNNYVDLIAGHLPDIVSLVLYRDEREENHKEGGRDPVAALKKVFSVWRQRGVFPEEVMRRCDRELLRGEGRASLRPGAHSSGKLFGNINEEETLRQMEEYRRETKRLKFESAQRDDEDAFGRREFEEMWKKTTGREDRRPYYPRDDHEAPPPPPFPGDIRPPSHHSPSPATPNSPGPYGEGYYASSSYPRRPPPAPYPPDYLPPYPPPPPHDYPHHPHGPPPPYEDYPPRGAYAPPPHVRRSPPYGKISPYGFPGISPPPMPHPPSHSHEPYAMPPPSRPSPPAPAVLPATPSSSASLPSAPSASSSAATPNDSRQPQQSNGRAPSPAKVVPLNPELFPYPSNTVFLWDLDETLILYNSFVTGDFSRRRNKPADEAAKLGERLENLIFALVDDHMFFKEIETFNELTIDALNQFDDGLDLRGYDFSRDMLVQNGTVDKKRLAYRFRHVRALYEDPRGVRALFSPLQLRELDNLLCEIDRFSDGWLSRAQQLLRFTSSQPSCLTFIVTSGQLIPTLAKMMLFGLHTYVSVDNILSSTQHGKEWVFDMLRMRLGESYRFIAVGDGIEEQTAAKKLGISFYPVTSSQDLVNLMHSLMKDNSLPPPPEPQLKK